MKKQNKKLLIGIWIVLAVIITLVLIGNTKYVAVSSNFYKAGSSDGISRSGTSNKLFAIVSCIPESGFSGCFENTITQTYENVQAQSYSKVQADISKLEPQGEGYYVGRISIPLKMTGDKFYFYENVGTYDNLWDNIAKCDANGCYNSKSLLNSNEDFVLAQVGEEYIGCPIFVAYDFNCVGECFNNESESPWAYASSVTSYGWPGQNGCLDIKAVNCYATKDCASGFFCNKTGDWKEWACSKQPECPTDEPIGEPFCEGNSTFLNYKEYIFNGEDCSYFSINKAYVGPCEKKSSFKWEYILVFIFVAVIIIYFVRYRR